MRLEVLVSCMHQKDASIIKRSNIQSDVLVINQCDENKEEAFNFVNKRGESCRAKIIYTTERGLSRSRNMAIRNATGDICLICDDDEVMEEDYVEKITQTFKDYPRYDIIAFMLNYPEKKFSSKTYSVGYFQAAKIGSWQIAFKRDKLQVTFCEKMGSGTGNGAGEENKFLVDCLKSGNKMRYVPTLIASLVPISSQWFHGYNQKYWRDRGWAAKMIYGNFWGFCYMWYCIFCRNWSVDKTNLWVQTMKWMHIGFFEHR